MGHENRSPVQTFTVTVHPVNDPPTASDVEIDTDEDRVLTIPGAELTANDIDPDLATNPDETLTVALPAESMSALGALLTFDASTEVLTYDPLESETLQALRPGELAVDRFDYTVVDAAGDSDTATVWLNVAGRNDVPVALADTFDVNPNAGAETEIRPLENDFDVDGTIDPASIAITQEPGFGSLTIHGDGTLSYVPDSMLNSGDTFRYSVADDLGERSEEATVTILPGELPVTADDSFQTVINQSAMLNVLGNDVSSGVDLDLSSVTLVSGPTVGQAVTHSDGRVEFIPADGFIGAASFRYTVADVNGWVSRSAQVGVEVIASPLRNPELPSDVNADGKVTALDALLIINRLSRDGQQRDSGELGRSRAALLRPER